MRDDVDKTNGLPRCEGINVCDDPLSDHAAHQRGVSDIFNFEFRRKSRFPIHLQLPIDAIHRCADIAAIGLAPIGFSIRQKLQGCFCNLYAHEFAAPVSANSRIALTIIRFTRSTLSSANADHLVEEVT
jgi:hypothetical protein